MPRAPATAIESQPIEKITAVGERTSYSIRLELETAETQLYDLFNELNSDDEFDVTCTEELFLGSHFKRRVCMADYLRKREARNSGNTVSGVDIALPMNALKGEVRHKTLAMEAEMFKLTQENKSFADAMLKLAELIGLMQAKKAENPLFFD